MKSLQLRSAKLPSRTAKLRRTVPPRAVPPAAKTTQAKSFTAHELDEAKQQELLSSAMELAQLVESGAEQSVIESHLGDLEGLSKAAGVNNVFPSINDGKFKSYTLTGRTKERTSSVITLGLLSFNAYQPASLKIKMSNSKDNVGVMKGPRDGVDTAYVIASPFEVMQAEEGAEGAKGTGIRGRSLAIGEYSFTEGNPQRLGIKFTKLQLEPLAENGQELQRWLETFAPHNANMDPKSGILVIPLPENSPQGFMDYLLMIPEFQLVCGNAGSKTLLQRMP